MRRPALYAVVALAGAAVLVLEILGTRVLAPSFGAGLYLWSVLIAVTLAALACGYAAGGAWATRRPSGPRLAALPALAGAWVALLPWLRIPVVAGAGALGARGSAIAAALALFFPPLALLGAVGPYAIRLGSRSLDEVGRTSGALLAVSTLASVAAALATGLVLIPALGVDRLLVAVALALFVAAAIARAGSGLAGAVAVLALGAGLGATGLAHHARLPAAVLACSQTPYGEVRVLDWNGMRYLTLDGSAHTIFNAETGEPRQAYVYAAELAADASRERGALLLVGLGGGGAAEVFSRRGWSVDAVEIDPGIVRLARAHFRLRPFHARVIVGDGREALRCAERRYDVVFLDAYGSAALPFHLVTREAFALARSRLVPGGILVANVEVLGWRDPLASAVAATMRSEFRNVVALPASEPPEGLGNVVLMASDRALDVTDEALGDPVSSLSDDDEHFRVLARHHAWENRYTLARGRVLTDDWNPSDLRADAINRAARAWLRGQIPDSLLAD